ncbi:rab11 family-interacting protein 5 [Hemicordylus capensis]|uniref:rab11 family-interacting protein 5 n=1 Tax=Hemicordylus capensis TaxID=884348 RepID=UPI0023024EE1|nr:rab11 family-interacting protein 5 [Hemicordylus capensis]
MSLLRVSELRAQMEEEAAAAASPSGGRWLPSHVQVTVVQARGLRPKGGPGDVFVVLQLGRQKHRTSVATEKGSGGPRWGEEVALELPPSAPEETDPAAAEALLLQLTVWQRALVGMDRFLGRASVPLAALLEGGRAHPDQWYKLHSKPGRKEKERGEIQVSLQFSRQSLTASMFDLSIKEKPRSPFGKLKDKVKGRRKYDLESASAIVPSSSGALDEDFDLGGKKAKPKGGGGGGFFFKSKLRKSSLTQSNTSLGSDSTVSSASSMAGIGPSELGARSPSRHSSLSTERTVRDFLPSPKLSHKRAFSDEVSQINTMPESKSVQSPKLQNEPISRSSLCINGSHIYCEEPSPKPSLLSSSSAAAAAAPPPLPPSPSIPSKPEEGFSAGPHGSEPELPPWSSHSFQKGPPKDPPRFIPSPPILAAQEEDKLSVKTIALNKHRGRVKLEEGLHAESKPIQIAAPMVFSADVVRVRPHEALKEEKRAGFFRHGSSKEESEKSAVPESVGPLQRVVAAGGEERGRSSSWFGLKDSREPSPKPSSQSEPLAATEVAKDASFSEDRGPPSSVRAAPQSVSHLEEAAAAAVAAAKTPPEWDDGFDALATSRLRPEAWRETPWPPPPVTDGPDRASPSEEAAELALQGEGEPWGTWEDPRPRSPAVASSAPEETLQESGGQQAPRAQPEDRPDRLALPWGAGSCEEASTPGQAGESCPPAREPVAGAGSAWGGGGGGGWVASAAGAPGLLLDSKPWLGHAPRDSPSRCTFLGDVFPEEEEEEERPLSSPQGSFCERPAPGLQRERPPSEADRGQESTVAEGHGWDLGRPEPGVSLAPPVSGLLSSTGEAEPPELAKEATRKPGCSGEEEEEEERCVTMETQEQRGEGERRTPEAPPPKPPRRFTPLNLEEEADGTQARWQDGAAQECEKQGGPAVETWQQDPPVGEAGPPSPPPVAAASPVPAALIGAGGKSSIPRVAAAAAAAEGEEPARANELRSPGGGRPSGGAPLLAAGEEEEEAEAAGAERLGPCPSELSLGRPGLRGATEDAGGEASLVPWRATRPQSLPLPGSAEQLPRPSGAGPGPSRTPQEPGSSPSVLFWTALEEQQLNPSPDCPGGFKQPAGPRLGEEEDASDVGPSPGQEGGPGLASAEVGQAPPASPLALAGRVLRQRHGGDPARESDGRGMDFKKPDFWQPGRGEQKAPPLVLGNPFAPRAGSPAQHNPFVERSPTQAPGLSFGDLPAETAPQGRPCAAPLAFSTPSLEASLQPRRFDLPSPVVVQPATGGGSAASRPASARPSLALPQTSCRVDASAPSVLPVETPPAAEVPRQRTTSPHPVKPISTPAPESSREEAEEQRPSTRTPVSSRGQERLEPSSADSAAPVLQLEQAEPKREPSGLDCSAKYYHLTHDELIRLLLKREAELSKKQEHVRELENYIDRLLVRIMEQSPTLLQIPLGGEPKAAK